MRVRIQNAPPNASAKAKPTPTRNQPVSQNHGVTVKARLDSEEIQIDIVDTGRGFDPASIEQANLEQLASNRKSGGLGMRLIRAVMDEVHYQIVPGQKNELRMVKRLKGQDPTPKP